MSLFNRTYDFSLRFGLQKFRSHPGFQIALEEAIESYQSTSGKDIRRILESSRVSITKNWPYFSVTFTIDGEYSSCTSTEEEKEEQGINVLNHLNKLVIKIQLEDGIQNTYANYIDISFITDIQESSVYLECQISGTEFLLKETILDLNCSNYISHEEEYLMLCSHSNVQMCSGHTLLQGQFYLVLESFEANLNEYIERAELNYQEILQILLEISQALAFIHMKRIVHNSVDANSIYVRNDGSVFIGNFSRAFCLDDENVHDREDFQSHTSCYDERRIDIHGFITLALELLRTLPQFETYSLYTFFEYILKGESEQWPSAVELNQVLLRHRR